MPIELPKRYDPSEHEKRIYRRWLDAGAFAAFPDGRDSRYVIMMPLPNVTGALHLGHAMDNVMQDLLIRWHRMLGDNTLWMPGADHAGIATQAVVEKRLLELEGRTRHDVGREALVARIWAWKDQYEKRIVEQQQEMGCSCDWNRSRFTMDPVCAAAVREAFFRLFRDGLIYRGDRLVNWDCLLQTAVSDDEIVYEKVRGHFWHMRYPVVDRKAGEPEFVTVATTRPETMLGDTAVACHPDPSGALERQIGLTRERLAGAPRKERPMLEEELRHLERRRETHLPNLLKLAGMARDGCKVLLPLIEREIPLVLDEWAKPELGSGCVKVTPGHDPNDYAVWQRHEGEIEIVNILNPDGTLNENAGRYAGDERFEARDKVVADLEAQGLLEAVEDREIEIGHSDRSKTPIEPYLSKQWFIRMGDVGGGVVCGRGTEKEFRSAGLAQAAIDAAGEGWSSPSGRRLRFHPDHERYCATYRNWLAEKRDWCISRQLWWGHRIPIWRDAMTTDRLVEAIGKIRNPLAAPDAWAWIVDARGNLVPLDGADALPPGRPYDLLVCLRDQVAEDKHSALLEAAGLRRDEDVLDTWFSSALWPFSTLGWPDPEAAKVNDGQAPLGATSDGPDALGYYFPGSCLVTARDIITLWVARMLVMGLHLLGDVPFTDCFIHANIQDGKGERMSKSKGNGIDPVDIIERYGADAMRYVLCDMQTGTQDIRLPVQAVSPYTGELVDLAGARHGRTIFTYICPQTNKEFDVLGTLPELPRATLISDRFDVGRSFCTKLWNAARFALMNLGEQGFRPVSRAELALEDRWILSRLARAIGDVTASLEAYNPSGAIGRARDFFWGELCDWYLEMIKPRLRDESAAPVARAVLALALDQVLRLFQPFVPFITEVLWEKLGEQFPSRGLEEPLPGSPLIISASWPAARAEWLDEGIEAEFDILRPTVRAIRELRARYDVPPSKQVNAAVKAGGAAAKSLVSMQNLVAHMAGLASLTIDPAADRPPLSGVTVIGDVEIFVTGLLDPARERARLNKQLERLAKDLAKVKAKLVNDSFLQRAPADIVEAERAKLDELETQMSLIEKNLKELP